MELYLVIMESIKHPPLKGTKGRSKDRPGFALVITLSLMVLLTVIAVGLLGLSAISLRSSSQEDARSIARANARMALMIALGELQNEMGPDMRVSAQSALFDSNPSTETVEGVGQSQWLASYDAWGDWLTANYARPGGGTLRIADTYGPRREKMFRRWLISLPEGSESDIDAPDSPDSWDEAESVELVGAGTLGEAAGRNPARVARA